MGLAGLPKAKLGLRARAKTRKNHWQDSTWTQGPLFKIDFARSCQPAFLEHALRKSDGAGDSIPGLQLGSQNVAGSGEHQTVSLQINLAAVGLEYLLQSSDDLSNWETAPGMTHISTNNTGNGSAVMTYRSNAPANTLGDRKYYRIQVTGQP